MNHLPTVTWLYLLIGAALAVYRIQHFSRKRKWWLLAGVLAVTVIFVLAASVILFNPPDNWP